MEECHTEWQIFEKKRRNIILTKMMEIHIIEIPKAIRSLKKEPKNKIVQWMTFLDDPNRVEVSDIMEKNKGIKKAMEKLKEISEDEKMRRITELREKAILDEKSAIRYATNEGMEKGIKQTQIENAKKMLKFKIDENIILEVTELTIEEIKRISKKN